MKKHKDLTIATILQEDTVVRKVLDATSQPLNIIYIELICSVCSQYGFRRFESVSGYCLSKLSK